METRCLDQLRAVEDGAQITWRGDAPFADWALTWGESPDAVVVAKVHRIVLVGGQRPAHFLAGELRGGPDWQGAAGTDLSKLVPEVCRPVLDKALDFVYSQPMDNLTAAEAPLLYKVADALQCPTLKNYVVDQVGLMIGKVGSDVDCVVAEVLAGAAALHIDELSNALVQTASVQALRQAVPQLSGSAPHFLAAIVPAFMERIGRSLGAMWGGVEHEGGSVRLDGPVLRFMGGGTCIAWSSGDVQSGVHSWRVRIDELNNLSGFIALGVVVGPKDSSHMCDMDSWRQWYLYYSDDGKKRTKGEADLQDYSKPFAPGDVISVNLDLDNRTLEFAQNGASCSTAFRNLGPGAYRAGVELGNSASDMEITLLSYDCTDTGNHVAEPVEGVFA